MPCCGRVPSFSILHQTAVFPWKLNWISHSDSPVDFSKKIALLMCVMEMVLWVRPNQKNLDWVCTWRITSRAFHPSGSRWIFWNSFAGSACSFNNPFVWKQSPLQWPPSKTPQCQPDMATSSAVPWPQKNVSQGLGLQARKKSTWKNRKVSSV